MGLDDVFSFNEAEYRLRITQLSDAELKKREREKHRRVCTSWGSAGAGFGGAAATGGLSLIFTVYSFRQLQVLKRKLKIIQRELGRRNIALHKLGWGDTTVAISATVLSALVGSGIDGMLGDAGGGISAAETTSVLRLDEIEISRIIILTFL
jgi:hypothetical protein